MPVECNEVVLEAIQVKHRSLNESQTGKKFSFMFALLVAVETAPPEVGEKEVNEFCHAQIGQF